MIGDSDVTPPPIGFGACNALNASLVEIVEAAAENGFQRITVNPHQFERSRAAGLSDSQLQDLVRAAGLDCTMLDALPAVLPDINPTHAGATYRMPDSPPSVDRCIQIAELLGIGILNITHYWGDPNTEIDDLAVSLAGVCDHAAEHDMAVSVEFIPGTGIPDITTASRVIQESNAANAGILLDVFHHARSGGTVDQITQLPPGSVLAVQLSDRVDPWKRQVALRGRSLLGQGDLPLQDLVRAALRNNPDATLDVEVLNDELAALETREVARILAASIEAWMATNTISRLD